MIIYTAGYSQHPVKDLIASVERLKAVVFDCRYHPASRRLEWERNSLQMQLGRSRYCWIQAWGNVNYKDKLSGKPIQISDFNAGLTALQIFERGGANTIILLCACRDLTKCHLSVLKTELESRGYHVQPLDWLGEQTKLLM